MFFKVKKIISFKNFFFLFFSFLLGSFLLIILWQIKNNSKTKSYFPLSFYQPETCFVNNDKKNQKPPIKKNDVTYNRIEFSVKFDQVSGMKAGKELLQRFIDFFKNPEKYKTHNISIPKGILFYGPPGTGKTFLAQAFAGEANVPFYSFVGTDFLQRIHGDSAKKIKDLFNEATDKEKNPKGSVIFIDEIDSFGATRNEFNPKEKEILIALLAALDGLKTKQNIIDGKPPVVIIAATNRFEILDSALIRPGRFDYLVKIDLPDLNMRQAILKSYAQGKNFNFDFLQLAQETPGMSAAQLKAIIEEAAFLNLTKNPNNQQSPIDMHTIIEAKDNCLLGIRKKDQTYDLETKEIIATHQAAKLIITQIKKSHFLSSVSLIPRESDKFLFLAPQPNSSYLTFQDDLFQRITVLLSGKAAEEVICKKPINETCSDFKEALKIAAELTHFFAYKAVSSKDKEEFQKDILKKCYSDAKALVSLNQDLIKDLIKDLAKFLKTQEFIPVEDIRNFLKNKNIQDNALVIENQDSKNFFTFILTFVLIFLVLTSIIAIIKVIYWFLDVSIFSLLANKYLIFLILNLLSVAIALIMFSSSYQPHNLLLSLFNSDKTYLPVAELFHKIDNYEIKNISYTVKNSWLEGLYHFVKIIDKNGQFFYCKLKPLSQNTFDQKITNLKVKDFTLIEEPHFDWINFFFKLILFLSSFVFLLYGCLNIKRLRKQLKNSKENLFDNQQQKD
ncbi:MAG: cell division protease FtsH [Candidatus Phytoplasma solani]